MLRKSYIPYLTKKDEKQIDTTYDTTEEFVTAAKKELQPYLTKKDEKQIDTTYDTTYTIDRRH